MIKDTVVSLKSNIMERFSSPLLGSFFLSWGIWNWKLVVTLTMGKEATAERINIIVKNYYDFEHLIKYPALSSIAFVVTYPIVSTIALVMWEWLSPAKRRIHAFLENKTPLTEEDARSLRTFLMEREREMEKLFEGKESEIRELRAEVEVRTAKVNNLEAELSTLKSSCLQNVQEIERLRRESASTEADGTSKHSPEKDLYFYPDEEQIDLLKEIASSTHNSLTEKEWGYGKNTTKFMYNCDILLQNKLIEKSYDNTMRDNEYSFTPKGRAFVVEHGLA